ncbi:hypothetical protein Tco_0471625 [Tanacetum coccineum]
MSAMHLHANVARFDRHQSTPLRPNISLDLLLSGFFKSSGFKRARQILVLDSSILSQPDLQPEREFNMLMAQVGVKDGLLSLFPHLSGGQYANLSGITHILHCFSLLSGLSINLKKSHLLGVGIQSEDVNAAALYFGCSTMKTPFKYLGVMVGGNSSTLQAWDDTIGKLKARLSNWKLKTLSVGGRLTLLKSVLGSTPIYNMSIYKVPKSVLQTMESIRRNFFNGVQCDERKIVWINEAKVLLRTKNKGGLGVSEFLCFK